MPTRKHMKNLKTYDKCFSASEVVDWLQKNLQKNSNFGSDVTKDQTVQLLNKLIRAKIIENVRDEESREFKDGELYRLSVKSPVRVLRTPGKSEKKEDKRVVLGDVGNGNTPRRNLELEAFKNIEDDNKSDISSLEEREKIEKKPNILIRKKRDSSKVRKAKEEAVKRDLNLSYFQSLPANSLIILDNDSTWRRVFSSQLANSLSSHHVKLLEQAELLNMERVMHNMTRVSSKGIVQLDDKREDLPHWVLSAMKCLANWPRQLRTVNGRESCLPSYPGFEQDVFNVVKDYFHDLKEPLTTFGLYDHFLDAYIKAEAVAAIPRHVSPPPAMSRGCHVHPGSATRQCTRPYTQTDLDQPGAGAGQFYTMSEADSEDFLLMTNQERTAKIKATFSCMPPLATSSVKTQSSSNNSTSTPNTSSLTPDMSTTAVMRTFLPPNSCFETVFLGNSPVTRIVPQAESETLHISRSGSCRSLSHIPNYGNVTRTAGTQTDTENDKSQDSIKRMPRWRRHKHRRSASMSGSDESKSSGGQDNPGYARSPPGLSTSVDNILDQERAEKNNFMLKYRQVSGDLRGSQELVEMNENVDLKEDDGYFKRGRSLSLSHHGGYTKSSRDRSIIESKTVRKEKRKNRNRDTSVERPGSGLTPALRRVRLERENNCYTNPALDSSSEKESDDVFISRSTYSRAPLATQECDLSPVPPPMMRNTYNASYRMATNHNLPRTSTKMQLENARQEPPKPPRALDMMNEPLYTVVGPGPIRRFTVPNVQQHHAQTLPHKSRQQPVYMVQPPLSSAESAPAGSRVAPLTRGNVARASMYSVTTQDSGHYSQVTSLPRSPSPTAMFKLLTLLLPPSYRRKLQLLLKFIMKISLNQNLKLDSNASNSSLAIDTFLEVILRPSNLTRHNRELATNIVQYFLDHYEQVLTPPQDLRREVEEQVYRSLVSRRLEAGEDPYPVTYCEQVTRDQYEQNRLSGSQAALKDLLETLLRDEKMERKNKKRKLKKFREAYPDMWRAKFPSSEYEPEFIQPTKEKSRLGSLSKLKSAIGV